MHTKMTFKLGGVECESQDTAFFTNETIFHGTGELEDPIAACPHCQVCSILLVGSQLHMQI